MIICNQGEEVSAESFIADGLQFKFVQPWNRFLVHPLFFLFKIVLFIYMCLLYLLIIIIIIQVFFCLASYYYYYYSSCTVET